MDSIFYNLRCPPQESVVDRPGLIDYTFALEASVPARVSILIAAFGYEWVGGVQGVLSLGLLTSQYAVEVGGALAIPWGIRSSQATVQVSAGDQRIRILIRHAIARVPHILFDRVVPFGSDAQHRIDIDFLAATVRINNGSVEELLLHGRGPN